MSKSSRDKGAQGERELIAEIEQWTGLRLQRNLSQAFAGGHDLIGLDDFAIEVKRYRDITDADKKLFWHQACKQADPIGKIPVVCFRQDRQPWRVLLPHESDFYRTEDYRQTVEIGLELFCSIIRENLK